VEGIDEEEGVAFLLAANLPASKEDEVGYFETELRREQIGSSACNFVWSDLPEGSFLELAYLWRGRGTQTNCDAWGDDVARPPLASPLPAAGPLV
jgi:hypothetical protein